MTKAQRTGHPLPDCVFTEAGMANRLSAAQLRWGQVIDRLCEQLYADRNGYGLNGVAVTRPRRARP